MSVKLFKYILVISNLILIVLPIIGIVLSYFFLLPRMITESTTDLLDNETKIQTLAFSFWGLVLILTSICFIGVAFTRSITLHLIAALLLCCPLALGVWIVVEQFLFRAQPNWLVASIAFAASLIWSVQVLTELILACALCCSPSPSKADPEGAPDEDADEKKVVAVEVETLHVQKETDEDGTEEEREKLVICAQGQQAFVPSPQGPPIPEADEEPDEDGEDEEEEEPDSQARDLTPNPNHPQELPLHTIPEERQQLLPPSGGGGLGSHNIHQCPLATPEDTGV